MPVILSDVMMDQPIAPGKDILYYTEGIDLILSNIWLSGMKVLLANAMGYETILRQYLNTIRRNIPHTARLLALSGDARHRRADRSQTSASLCLGRISSVERGEQFLQIAGRVRQ